MGPQNLDNCRKKLLKLSNDARVTQEGCQDLLDEMQTAFKNQINQIQNNLEEKLMCIRQETECTDSDILGTIELLTSVSDEINQVSGHLRKAGMAPQAVSSELYSHL